MARYVQRKQEDGSYKLVPVDEAAMRREGVEISIRGNFDAFRSIVDGTLIRNQRDLDEHNKRNGVVNAHEFSDDWYAKKAKERERLYSGERTPEKVLRDRQFINEVISAYERK